MSVRTVRNQTSRRIGNRQVQCTRLEIANFSGATAVENYAELINEDTTTGVYKFVPGHSYMVGVQYAQHA